MLAASVVVARNRVEAGAAQHEDVAARVVRGGDARPGERIRVVGAPDRLRDVGREAGAAAVVGRAGRARDP